MKIFYLDTETGGPDPRYHSLLQLSGAIEIDWEVKEKFDLFVRPYPDDPEITKEASDKHGITAEVIAANPEKFRPPAEVYGKVLSILDNYVNKFDKLDKCHMVGYNVINFDDPVLRRFFSRNDNVYYGSYFWYPPVDVMAIYGADWAPYRHKFPNFQLKTVAKAAGLKVEEEKLHDGLYDIKLTRELFIKRYNQVLGK